MSDAMSDAALRRCRADALHDFIADVLAAVDTPDDIAADVAAHLVRAHLAGRSSHGLTRLAGYIERLDQGRVVPSARPRWVRDDGATGLLDAQRGWGHHAVARAVEWGVERAREHGIAAVAVAQTPHIGRLGDYVEQAAAAGMASQISCGFVGEGTGGVVPYGAAQRFMGTNPWAFGIPVEGRDPVVLDAATTVISAGKVNLAAELGESIDSGMLVAPDGSPTTDPVDYQRGGGLMALGGDKAGYKGTGLALVGAMLGGLAMLGLDDQMLQGPGSADPAAWVGGVLLVVLDPRRFGPPEVYATRANTVLDAYDRLTPRAGGSPPRVPGTRSAATRRELERDGIVVPDGTWAAAQRLAERFGVAMPATMG